MGCLVQARLDDETKATLDQLVQKHGLSRSEILREGIRLVKQQRSKEPKAVGKPLGLIGAGEFDSGIADLSSNPKHLENFGKKWRNGKWDW